MEREEHFRHLLSLFDLKKTDCQNSLLHLRNLFWVHQLKHVNTDFDDSKVTILI